MRHFVSCKEIKNAATKPLLPSIVSYNLDITYKLYRG